MHKDPLVAEEVLPLREIVNIFRTLVCPPRLPGERCGSLVHGKKCAPQYFKQVCLRKEAPSASREAKMKQRIGEVVAEELDLRAAVYPGMGIENSSDQACARPVAAADYDWPCIVGHGASTGRVSLLRAKPAFPP